MKIIIVCSQSIVFLSVLFAVFTSATALIAGSGSITVLSGCDDTHYRLNITTVSRPAWRGLQGVTASSTEGSHTWKHTHTHTHPTNTAFFCTNRHDCGNELKNLLWKCLQMEMQAEISLSHTHTHTHTLLTPVDTKPGMNTHLSCQFSLYRSSELFCPWRSDSNLSHMEAPKNN